MQSNINSNGEHRGPETFIAALVIVIAFTVLASIVNKSCFCHCIRTDRFDLESANLSEEFVICHPLEFHGRIHRKLSPWHKEMPSLEVFAEMGGVAVCVSPADVAAAKTLIDSATAELGGGQAARTEEEGEESKGEVEEKAALVPEGENDGLYHTRR